MTAAAGQPANVINQPAPQPAGQYRLSEFIVHTAAGGSLGREGRIQLLL